MDPGQGTGQGAGTGEHGWRRVAPEMKTPICDMLGIELPLLRLGARVRR
jgi:hypothetical protein